MIGLPRPGCRETVAPIEQHEYTRHITARHQHGRLSTRRAPPNSIGASGPRIADRRIWTTASRMNQTRLFSGHQSDHKGGHELAWPPITRHEVRAPWHPPLGVQRTYTSACIRCQGGWCNGLYLELG